MLHYMRDDARAGELFFLSGDHGAFSNGTTGFSDLMDMLQSSPLTSLATQTVVQAEDFAARIHASSNFTDRDGHATRLILTGDADNILRMGDRIDFVLAGDGDDWISASGKDTSPMQFGGSFEDQTLRGGTGEDVFVFRESVYDGRVRDFEPGIDRLDARSVLEWGDFGSVILAAEQKSYGVRLMSGDGVSDIYLYGAMLGDLSESDFIF